MAIHAHITSLRTPPAEPAAVPVTCITPDVAHMAMNFFKTLREGDYTVDDTVFSAQQLTASPASHPLDIAVKLAAAGRYWGGEDNGNKAFSSLLLLGALIDLLEMAAAQAAQAEGDE